MGCPQGDGAMDASIYTQNGDTYSFDFNPYTTCMNTPDPNNAATYSVDFKLLFSNSQTIAGQTMYFSGDQVDLKCTFQSTYTLTSDLGGVNLEGDQLVGTTFELNFEMTRTQADYQTEETGTVVANHDIYHRIASTTTANMALTDFSAAPSRIRLEKKNSSPAQFFDLWNKDMTSCGHSEIGFEMDYSNGVWTFKYKAFLLDTEQGAEYQIVADMELCNSLSTDAKCTAADDKCVAAPHSTFASLPQVGGGWTLVRRAHEWLPEAADRMAGTAEYGTYVNDPLSPTSFSMRFDNIPHTEFLFVTGDQTRYAHVLKSVLIGEYYNLVTERPVISSSKDPTGPHTLPMGNRDNSGDDPWIAFKWGGNADREVLYGGDRYCAGNAACWASWIFSNASGGINVFIR